MTIGRAEYHGRTATLAIVGTPADCVKKLERTIEAAARQFWVSIHFDDTFHLLRHVAEQVIPALR